MARQIALLGLLSCIACGASSPAVESSTTPGRRGETCSSAGPSAAASQRLSAATNLIEYENAWRAEHPGATTGSISGAEVRSLVRSKLSQVHACFAAGRSSDGSGRVVVRFVIDADGRVSTANLDRGSFGAPEVGCCVVKRVAEWTFPKPSVGDFVTVEYPFTVRVSHGN